MKLFILILVLLTASCAKVTTYSLIRYEHTGPVRAEIWKNNKTGKCERRVYMTVVYITEVECKQKEDVK